METTKASHVKIASMSMNQAALEHTHEITKARVILHFCSSLK
jgi:hypothetical protein